MICLRSRRSHARGGDSADERMPGGPPARCLLARTYSPPCSAQRLGRSSADGKNDSMTWLNRFAHGDQRQFTLRPATVDDAYLLADIVMAATKAQGRWPAMTSPE